MKSPSPVLIMADAHLRGPKDPNQIAMIDFLENARHQYSSLVVLGDFFEFMAGNNRTASKAFGDVLNIIERFDSVELIEGNHDFDLCNHIPGLQKANIYSSTAKLDLAGHRCLALHGDRASPGDVGTKALRAVLQSRAVRLLRDKILPDFAIFHFALLFAQVSRTARWPGRKYEETYTVQMAAELLKKADMDGVFFAHTHKAHLEHTKYGFSANPGAAHLDGGSYIHMEQSSLELRSFPSAKPIKQLALA